jgi:hypothetical protein
MQSYEHFHHTSFIARLGHHLLQGPLLRQISAGLVGGKIGHALAAVIAPRLPGSAAKATGDMASLQVAYNDVARTVNGGKRSDKTKVERDPLGEGKPPFHQRNGGFCSWHGGLEGPQEQ